MKKITLALFFTVLISIVSFGQARKGAFKLSPSNTHHLYVSFDALIHFEEDSDYIQEAIPQVPGIRLLIDEYHIQLEKGIAISNEKLDAMAERAKAISGKSSSVQKLRNIFKIKIDNPSNQRLLELAGKLEKLDEVEYCSLISAEAIRPPSDILPVTTNFEPLQTYIGADPGVNMQYAWDLEQSGAGIKIRDVEYGLNKNHEEFVDIDANVAPGMTINSTATTDYTEHGTSVFGIVYADKGTYGVSGLAYGADEMLLYPEWQEIGYNRVFAVAQSIANSDPGDVIIYEMQEYGQNNNYVCAEFNSIIWDLTEAATNAGIIVVAAAGNGNQDLDSAFYTEYMERGDSGAIIVGAGSSDVFHDKLYYSTYGSRVDLQAWGENVYTTGYMPPISGVCSYLIAEDFNQSYSTCFSGTSSATPIVASCAVVLQSYYHSLTNQYMTSQELRDVMKDTGVLQGNIASGNIGPIPDMEAAMQEIYNEYILDNKDFTATEFRVYPNPVENQITIMTNSSLSSHAKVEIYNALGQMIHTSDIGNNNVVDLSNFSSGFYFVKVTDRGNSSIQKIIKK